MSQQNNPNLINSIQSEVSKEASPLLDFLVKNSKKIALAVLLIAVVAIAYGSYTLYAESALEEARDELGRIVVRPDSAEKIQSLLDFAEPATGELKTAALMAAASAATTVGNYELAAKTWNQAAELVGEPMYFSARMGEASALGRLGREPEALEILLALQGKAAPEQLPVLSGMILEVAEQLGRWDVAMQSCELIIGNDAVTMDKAFWRQRLEYLRLKQAESPAGEQAAEPVGAAN
ncbi:MAG: hypothetical protein LBV80_10285 [Deltaproteobacteria bacterium]|jgi:predicted negative regulator of RcsB-dependent stress response|nr:hypothetical protein [Deltaproteobacteria bacterium]